jgi:peptidyl-tRNA hydrolase
VRTAAPEHWAHLCRAVENDAAVAVRDAGFTEVAPGTITAIVTPDHRSLDIEHSDAH